MVSRIIVPRSALSTSILRNARPYTSTSILRKDEHPKSTKGLKPKILDEKPPSKDEQSDDVKKHNEEMDKRADQATAKMGDKKDKETPQKTGSSDYSG